MTDTTEKRVMLVIEEHLAVAPARITADASLIDDLGADSLDHMELAMALEDEFGVTIEDDDMGKAVTVADLIALVERVRADSAA